MTPTGILKQEHEHILVMLKVINRVCSIFQTGGHIRPEDLLSITDFLRNFADRCHHAKEEKLLFPALERVGVLRESGPIGIMLHEHEQGRALVMAMDEAAVRYGNGEVTVESAFVGSAGRYVDLISRHITREDSVLFTMADERLDEKESSDIVAGFEMIEKESGEGVHEKYGILLRRFSGEYLV